MQRTDIINKLVNLSNNLNKKREKFYKAGYGEMFDSQLYRMTNKYEHKANLVIDRSGRLSKAKREFEKLSDREIKDLYQMYNAIQHHKDYGTVKKYEKFIELKNEKFDRAIQTVTGDKYKELSKNEREELYKRLEVNRQSNNFVPSDQVIIGYYSELDDEDEELKEVLRRRERSTNFLSKFKLNNRR